MREELQKWLEVTYKICMISTKKQTETQSVEDVDKLLNMLKKNHRKEMIQFLEDIK